MPLEKIKSPPSLPATLPHVEIKWTERELAALVKLVFALEANRPTDALIRAMRD